MVQFLIQICSVVICMYSLQIVATGPKSQCLFFVFFNLSERNFCFSMTISYHHRLFIRHTSAEINEVLNNEPSIEKELLVIRMMIDK